MSPHDMLVTLNLTRMVMLIAGIIFMLTHKKLNRVAVICVAVALLALNLSGLAIATLLLHRG